MRGLNGEADSLVFIISFHISLMCVHMGLQLNYRGCLENRTMFFMTSHLLSTFCTNRLCREQTSILGFLVPIQQSLKQVCCHISGGRKRAGIIPTV